MTGPCCDLKEGRKEEGRPHTALASNYSRKPIRGWTGLWMGPVSPAGFGLETSSGHPVRGHPSRWGWPDLCTAFPEHGRFCWFARTLSKSDSALSSCF